MRAIQKLSKLWKNWQKVKFKPKTSSFSTIVLSYGSLSEWQCNRNFRLLYYCFNQSQNRWISRKYRTATWLVEIVVDGWKFLLHWHSVRLLYKYAIIRELDVFGLKSFYEKVDFYQFVVIFLKTLSGNCCTTIRQIRVNVQGFRT